MCLSVSGWQLPAPGCRWVFLLLKDGVFVQRLAGHLHPHNHHSSQWTGVEPADADRGGELSSWPFNLPFFLLRNLTGSFPDYPKEEEGGSAVIFSNKTPQQVHLRLRNEMKIQRGCISLRFRGNGLAASVGLGDFPTGVFMEILWTLTSGCTSVFFNKVMLSLVLEREVTVCDTHLLSKFSAVDLRVPLWSGPCLPDSLISPPPIFTPSTPAAHLPLRSHAVTPGVPKHMCPLTPGALLPFFLCLKGSCANHSTPSLRFLPLLGSCFPLKTQLFAPLMFFQRNLLWWSLSMSQWHLMKWTSKAALTVVINQKWENVSVYHRNQDICIILSSEACRSIAFERGTQNLSTVI